MAKGDRPSQHVVKAGDRSLTGLIAREAVVTSEHVTESYLGFEGMHVQAYTVKYKNGKTAAGQQIIYRADKNERKKFGYHTRVSVGDRVMTYAPDRRQGVYHAEIVNNIKYK